MRNKNISASGMFAILFLFVWIVLSWVTHVAVCIKTSAWLFLIAGAICVPVAWIHGTGYWLGLW